MDLQIHNIKFKNFRNYQQFDSGEFDSFNIFIGRNGVGKTNIIEGIQLLTTLESFKHPKWNEVVKWGNDNCEVSAEFFNEQRQLKIQMCITNNKRSYFLNGKSKKNKDLRGLLPAVLFCPDDLQLVKGYSEHRRESLDSIGSQISDTYYTLKSDYQKAIKQKNKLLQTNEYNAQMLYSWNENIAILGSAFIKHRLSLFQKFRKNLVRISQEMLDDLVIDIVYIPSWEEENNVEITECDYLTEQIQQKFRYKTERLKEAELAAGKTLFGPHKDDIKFYLNGYDAKKFASQGQQRFIVLCWKIAEMQTISDICGQQPILLLDDVMSEFDKTKRDTLVDYLIGSTQTFITATDVDNIDATIIERARVFKVGDGNGS